MFRDLLKWKRGISKEECIEILKKETRGVLSVIGDDDYPYCAPMNHFYNEDDGKIYFHCGNKGHRIDALQKNKKVSFCTYEQGEREDGEWAYRVRSVIVFGQMEIIDDMEKIKEITTKLCYKFIQDEAYIQKEIELYAHETLLLELTPEHMTGKRVTES